MPKRSCFAFILLSVFLLHTASSFGTDYILYVRARSDLGGELRSYWQAVRSDPDIDHKAIRDFPPHCSLTGFFPKKSSKGTYIKAVKDAIQQVNLPRVITINGLIQGNEHQKLDYIKLSSAYLLAVTQAFMNNASIPQKYLKNPLDFPYHITLRDHIFQKNVSKKMKKIQSLERKINLSAKTYWSLFLYKRENGTLDVIEEFPL